jgi:hypothetical protein
MSNTKTDKDTTIEGELFYKTFLKWYRNRDVHHGQIIERLFSYDNGLKLHVSNSRKKVDIWMESKDVD